MTPEQEKKLDDLHSFFFENSPGLTGDPNRAQQIETLLKGYRAGSLSIKFFIWFSGILTAFGAMWLTIKGILS